MPWNEQRYPVAMKNLAPGVRQKAIEVANALLMAGSDEGRAIRIGIAKAKAWSSHLHAAGRWSDQKEPWQT